MDSTAAPLVQLVEGALHSLSKTMKTRLTVLKNWGSQWVQLTANAGQQVRVVLVAWRLFFICATGGYLGTAV